MVFRIWHGKRLCKGKCRREKTCEKISTVDFLLRTNTFDSIVGNQSVTELVKKGLSVRPTRKRHNSIVFGNFGCIHPFIVGWSFDSVASHFIRIQFVLSFNLKERISSLTTHVHCFQTSNLFIQYYALCHQQLIDLSNVQFRRHILWTTLFNLFKQTKRMCHQNCTFREGNQMLWRRSWSKFGFTIYSLNEILNQNELQRFCENGQRPWKFSRWVHKPIAQDIE